MGESSHDPLGIEYAKKDFICPACGSTAALGRMFVSRDPKWDLEHPGPWAGVLQTVTCAQCQCTIPAHLGYRWGLTLEEARAEWHARYREDTGAHPDATGPASAE